MSDTPRTDAAEIISMHPNDLLGWPEGRKTGVVPKSKMKELERELAEARELLRQCLKVMPCGHIPTHTIENLPKMISDLATELAEETAHHETLEGMYHKVVSACLRCDPIPAGKREDDELEPPWEVIDRVKSQRDRLAEALRELWNNHTLHGAAHELIEQTFAAVKGGTP